MAVGQREERQPARWLHVKRGDLVDKKNGESLGWASGVITGIRMTRSERFGHLELHVRLHDPELDETVIIAGTLATLDQGARELRDFTIWARMLVGRLISKANKLQPDEPVRIEFYPLETDYGDASCVAVYRDGSDVRLEGRKISVEDREVMAKALFWLSDQYPWGAGSTALPVREDVEQLAAAERTEPARESADAVAGSIEATAEDAETLPDYKPAIEAEESSTNADLKELFGGASTVTEEQRRKVEQVAADENGDDDDLPF